MCCREANNHIVLIECVCVLCMFVCVYVRLCVCLCLCVSVLVCWCLAEKLWKECWQHWCKKMSGIEVFLTVLISKLTSNISFIQLSSFNCLQCFRDIRRLVLTSKSQGNSFHWTSAGAERQRNWSPFSCQKSHQNPMGRPGFTLSGRESSSTGGRLQSTGDLLI